MALAFRKMLPMIAAVSFLTTLFSVVFVVVCMALPEKAYAADIPTSMICSEHGVEATLDRVQTINPTCTQDGRYVYKHQITGAVTYVEPCSRTVLIVPALGHNWTVDERIEATCTNDGSIHSTCSRCGETKNETITALGHDYPVPGLMERSNLSIMHQAAFLSFPWQWA